MLARSGRLSLIAGRDRGRLSTNTVNRFWPSQCATNLTLQLSSFKSIATHQLRQEITPKSHRPAKDLWKRYSQDEDTTIVLRKTEGSSNEEIAEELNRSKESVSQRIQTLTQYYPNLRKRGRGLTTADQAEVDFIQRSISDDSLSVAEVCQRIGHSARYVRRRLRWGQRRTRPGRTADTEALVLGMKAQGHTYESIAHNLDIDFVKVQNILAARTRSRQRTPKENLNGIPKQRQHNGWTADEDAKLLASYEQGQRAPKIALELNRHLINTRVRLRQLLISKGQLVPNGKLRYEQATLEEVVNLREQAKLTWKQIAERFPERSFRAWQWHYFAHKKRTKGKS